MCRLPPDDNELGRLAGWSMDVDLRRTGVFHLRSSQRHISSATGEMVKVPGAAAPNQFILFSRPFPKTGEGASNGVATLVRL